MLSYKSTTNTLIMVRPEKFALNHQTLKDNIYQSVSRSEAIQAYQQKVLQEFDTFVDLLKSRGIDVLVFQGDDLVLDAPDAVFPNNWISFHQNAQIVLYPMLASNRRLERKLFNAITERLEQYSLKVPDYIIDYTEAEKDGFFLEGTGSMVLDRKNRVAYCNLSSRSDEELFIEFCEDLQYSPIVFSAYQEIDSEQHSIYHTNVMMSICEHYALLGASSISDKKERKIVMNQLKKNNKELILLTQQQLLCFAANALEVIDKEHNSHLIMSTKAFQSLTVDQINIIGKYSSIIHTPLDTIETLGGGSARCMLAEVFLPELSSK